MPARIQFTDSIGAATMSLDRLRFDDWSSDVEEISDAANVLGTGVRYREQYRVDYVASFSARKLTGEQETLSARIKLHLLSGGTIKIVTNDESGSVYTVRQNPNGSLPSMQLDTIVPVTHRLNLSVKNTVQSPLTIFY